VCLRILQRSRSEIDETIRKVCRGSSAHDERPFPAFIDGRSCTCGHTRLFQTVGAGFSRRGVRKDASRPAPAKAGATDYPPDCSELPKRICDVECDCFRRNFLEPMLRTGWNADHIALLKVIGLSAFNIGAPEFSIAR
jgi:hypothetical protein